MGKDACRAAVLCEVLPSFGYERAWNFRCPHGFTALGLQARRGTGEGAGMCGVLFAPGSSMESFDLREQGYVRKQLRREDIRLIESERSCDCDCCEATQGRCAAAQVRALVSWLKGEPMEDERCRFRIWVYVPTDENIGAPEVGFPICQTYVDVVVGGCLAWGGESLALSFLETTLGWSTFFLNDVPLARRPWLHRPKEWRAIDHVLKLRRRETHFDARKHPEEYAALTAASSQGASAVGDGSASADEPQPTQPVRIGVGSSSDPDARAAVDSAWAMLCQQLGDDSTPQLHAECSMIVVGLTPGHDAAAVADALRAHAPRTPFVGGTSCSGLMVQHSWHGAGVDGSGVGLWGIQDADGWYEACHVALRNDHASMADATAAAARAGLRRAVGHLAARPWVHSPSRTADGAPAGADGTGTVSFVFLVGCPGHEDAILEGLRAALGSEVTVVGGSSADTHIAGEWWQVSSHPPQVTQSGASFVLCWPSVVVHSTFCSGFTPTARSGLVTRVSRTDPRTIETIDDRPAAIVYDEWTDGAVLQRARADAGARAQVETSPVDVLAASVLAPLGQRAAGEPSAAAPMRVLHPRLVDDCTGCVTVFAEVAAGERVHLMSSTDGELGRRVARLARAGLHEADLARESVVGSLCIFCAGCALHLGRRMHLTTEELAAELGWRPMLGLCTFGEQGTFCTGEAEHGNLMFSIVLFSNVRLAGRATRAPASAAPAATPQPPTRADRRGLTKERWSLSGKRLLDVARKRLLGGGDEAAGEAVPPAAELEQVGAFIAPSRARSAPGGKG